MKFIVFVKASAETEAGVIADDGGGADNVGRAVACDADGDGRAVTLGEADTTTPAALGSRGIVRLLNTRSPSRASPTIANATRTVTAIRPPRRTADPTSRSVNPASLSTQYSES